MMKIKYRFVFLFIVIFVLSSFNQLTKNKLKINTIEIRIFEDEKISSNSIYAKTVPVSHNEFIQNHNDIINMKKKTIKVSINGFTQDGTGCFICYCNNHRFGIYK
jgi:hypothetical protein